MPSIICQKCREINEPNATICQRCGARLCHSCHLVIESPSASVCPHCGKKDLTFRPGKYSASTYIAAGSQGTGGFGQFYCPNCGSKIDPGVKKCPYCGRLGTLVTQTPVQGFGVMQPAHGERAYTYTSPEPERPVSTQKVCRKCGTPIPPGSSLCPIHGKFGGGNILAEGPAQLPGRHTGDLWRKIEEKRAASSSSEQTSAVSHHTPPQQIYPQMSAVPQASKEIYALPETDTQRICPSCGSAVPDRSKVCPTCGWNRLPPQRTRPIIKAEEFYKASEAAAQPYPVYKPPVDQYYGQPGVMPYESMYPPQPVPMEQPYEKKGRRKERRPREAGQRESRPQQKQPILPLLLSLLAIIVVMGFAATYILGELNKPATPVMLPKTPTETPTTSKAPVISNVEFKDISQNSAVVTWTTDKKSNSAVIYCLLEGEGIPADKKVCVSAEVDDLVTDHSVKLTGLEPNQSYHITVQSNLDGKLTSPETSQEVEQVLRLLGIADKTPPVISTVNSVNITGSSATITWKTDEPATSQVAYGTSSTYGTLQPAQTDTTLMPSHEVMLQGLPPLTTFNFMVISRDASGNEATSPNAKFTTTPPAGTTIGYLAPDFTLVSAADGSNVSLNSLRGKKVIINFWNTRCPYCMGEMPYFQTIRENNPESSVAILAINSPAVFGSDNPVHVGEAIKNYTFTVLLDSSGSVTQAYNCSSGIPVTYFLDAKGIVQKFQNGSFENAADIQSMLGSY